LFIGIDKVKIMCYNELSQKTGGKKTMKKQYKINELFGYAWLTAHIIVYNNIASSFELGGFNAANNELMGELEKISNGFNLKFDENGQLI
jgi:hypothetical protein